MQKRILIWEVPYWVGLYNEWPGEWVAVGEAGGRSIEVVGDSEFQAIELWRKEAEAILPKR